MKQRDSRLLQNGFRMQLQQSQAYMMEEKAMDWHWPSSLRLTAFCAVDWPAWSGATQEKNPSSELGLAYLNACGNTESVRARGEHCTACCRMAWRLLMVPWFHYCPLIKTTTSLHGRTALSRLAASSTRTFQRG